MGKKTTRINVDYKVPAQLRVDKLTDWVKSNKDDIYNRNWTATELHKKYESSVGSAYSFSVNKFSEVLGRVSSSLGFYFYRSRVRGKTIYHLYFSELDAKKQGLPN